MGRFCHICGRVRANERLTGHGHRSHVCKDCQGLPRGERDRIEDLHELHCFLGQSNISAKNMARLRALGASAGEEVRQLAELVLDIALVHPRKRRRLKFLVGQRWNLFARMHALLGAEYFDDFMDGGGPHNDWLLEALERVAGKRDRDLQQRRILRSPLDRQHTAAVEQSFPLTRSAELRGEALTLSLGEVCVWRRAGILACRFWRKVVLVLVMVIGPVGDENEDEDDWIAALPR